MRIEYQTEGGIAFFPGLSKPAVIDSNDLTDAESARLKGLVEAARFFELPSAKAARRGAADYRQYTISIEDGQRHHTIHLADPIEDADLRALVDFLSAKARQKR
jgi:hypothetical protein